jgi:hypothetical protein
VHSGFIDTRLAARVSLPKHPPAFVATAILDAVEGNVEELLIDERTRQMKAALPHDQDLIYPEIESQFHATRA